MGMFCSCFLRRSDDGAGDGIYQVDFLPFKTPGRIRRRLCVALGISDRQSELFAFFES